MEEDVNRNKTDIKEDISSKFPLTTLMKEKRDYLHLLETNKESMSKEKIKEIETHINELDDKILEKVWNLPGERDTPINPSDFIEDVRNALLCCPWSLTGTQAAFMLLQLIEDNKLSDVIIFCSIAEDHFDKANKDDKVMYMMVIDFVSKIIAGKIDEKDVPYNELMNAYNMRKLSAPELRDIIEKGVNVFKHRAQNKKHDREKQKRKIKQ